ncbi:MAG: hypothetical protein AAF662_05165 [Pseudomonadota bacterium]
MGNRLVAFGLTRVRLGLVALTGVIAGCGGPSIDAKNADTLRATISEISAEMTEEERRLFAQDMWVIWIYRNEQAFEDSISHRGRRNLQNRLFRSSYESFYRTGTGPSYENNFPDMAREIASTIDGKSPAQVAKEANKIRRRVFAMLRDEMKRSRAALQSNAVVVEKQIESLRALTATQQANMASALKQVPAVFDNALLDVSFSDTQPKIMYRTTDHTGSATFKNLFGDLSGTSEKGVCKIVFTVTLNDGTTVRASARTKGGIKPGAEGTLSATIRTRDKHSASVLSGDFQVVLDEVDECGYSRSMTRKTGDYFRPEVTEIQRRDRTIANCQRLAADHPRMAKSLEPLIEKLDKLADRPSAPDIELPAFTVNYRGCLPNDAVVEPV